MPLLFNQVSSNSQFPTCITRNTRGTGCSFSQLRIKKAKKKYKNGGKSSKTYSKVKSKFSLTPALISILESFGYKVKKQS